MKHTFEIYEQIALLNVEEAVTHPDLLVLGTEFKKISGTKCTHIFGNFVHANLDENSKALLARMKDTLAKVTHKIVEFCFDAESFEKALMASHVPEFRPCLDLFKMNEKLIEVEKTIKSLLDAAGGDSATMGQKEKLIREIQAEERFHKFFDIQIKVKRDSIAKKLQSAGENKPVPNGLLLAKEKAITEAPVKAAPGSEAK